jgi:hypothetical protein
MSTALCAYGTFSQSYVLCKVSVIGIKRSSAARTFVHGNMLKTRVRASRHRHRDRTLSKRVCA